MINVSTPQNTRIILLLFFFFLTFLGQAQIGIGTVTPNGSSVLDITSTTKGLLAPRMTTTERNAIGTPAESLLVYDTTVKAFYYYNTTTTSWLKIANESSTLRNNYKLVKSVADLAPELIAGGNTSYKLTSNTLYEINGTILLLFPIDLNDAYVSGVDTNEDVLQSSGVVFKGSTGGGVRNVTLKGTKAFEITGSASGSLLVQNTVINGMTSGVGSISGLGLYFANIVQFVSNTGGITYSNIGNLLLSNQAWFSSNSGTFETFTGTFSLIQKNSGFSTLDGSDVAMDVSTLGAGAVGTGILIGTVFSGTTTSPLGIINRYPATSTYTGYNFSNAWTVESPGIPREADNESTGDINLNATVGSGVASTFPLGTTGTPSRIKVAGTTASNNLFRFTKDGDNRITYRGTKTRYFQIAASVSYQTTAEATLIFYIARNGVVLTETKVYGRPTTGLLTTAGIIALPIIGSVQLKTGDYIEIYVERYAGLGDLSTVSLNLTAR